MVASDAPDPSQARNLAEFITALAELRHWAGGPSYRVLARRVGPLLRPPQVIAHTTVSSVFQPQRRRLDIDLVTAIVRALGRDEPEVLRWRKACVRVHVQGKAGNPAGTFRQLPADLATFTGRGGELKHLLDIAADAARGGTTVVISAIDGMAGIGKTALAVHAGHLLAEQFPDGQLFVDLHAHSAGAGPRDPDEVLGELLQVLGLDLRAIPPGLEERAKAFRNRLAGTRTLILLDNAASEQQIRPLFPAAAGCLVLVTSRNRLKALDDAHPLPLDVLEPADAIALLRHHIGPGRVAAEDPAVARIAELCGYLPLALRITAANLAHRRTWTAGHMEARLRAGLANLAAFDDGDRQVAVAFDLSYTNLTPDQQAAFRHLGLIPGSEGDVYAAAALLDTGLAAADGLLQDLTDRSLLAETAPGRYRLHDLLREYARTLAVTHDSTEQRQSALDRLLHYYAHTAQSASTQIARWPRPAPEGAPPAHSPDVSDPESARAWLRTEHSNLDAAHTHARNLDQRTSGDQHTIALAAGMAEILLSDGPWVRALEIHRAAAGAATRLHRPAAHATALTDLGQVQHQRGDYPGATDAHTQALQIYQRIGSRSGEANALANLGRVRHQSGDYRAAADAHTRALDIYREIGNRLGEANALASLGRVRHQSGDYAAAADAHTRALDIYRQIGHRSGEASALTNVGRIRHQSGDYPAASQAHSRALEIYQQIGNDLGEANALTNVGQVRHQSGDYAAAADAHTRALEIYRQIGSPNEGWALNFYAATVAALGDRPRALALYQQALEMNRDLRKPDDEAFSLEGIADHHLAAGDLAQGVACLNQALEIYERLGMRADLDRVRAQLSELDAR